MALKAVAFPAVYERLSPKRTEEEIWAAVNSRFDKPSVVRYIATTELAPPPPDSEMPATKTIGHQTRRKPRGRPPTAKVVIVPCRVHVWQNIGKSKTQGKIRVRCSVCRREGTVPEAEAPPRVYKKD